MTKKLERDLNLVRQHLQNGNREAAQKLANFMYRSARTTKEQNAVLEAIKTL